MKEKFEDKIEDIRIPEGYSTDTLKMFYTVNFSFWTMCKYLFCCFLCLMMHKSKKEIGGDLQLEIDEKGGDSNLKKVFRIKGITFEEVVPIAESFSLKLISITHMASFVDIMFLLWKRREVIWMWGR